MYRDDIEEPVEADVEWQITNAVSVKVLTALSHLTALHTVSSTGECECVLPVVDTL